MGTSDYILRNSAVSYVKRYQNSFLKSLFGAENFDQASLRENIDGFLKYRVSHEIINDLVSLDFRDLNGQDLLAKWNDPGFDRPQTVAFAGEFDELGEPLRIHAEAEDLGYRSYLLRVGHMGAFYDKILLPKLADFTASFIKPDHDGQRLMRVISERSAGSCKTIFH